MKIKCKSDNQSKQKVIVVYQKKSYLVTKRVTDFIGSVIGIILFLPICIFIAIIIKFQDRGPVFFKQKRVGKNGSYFYMYKFRSMCIDAEKLKFTILEKNEIDGAMFKMKNDPRITKFGRFIRKHSLDELPQLINILLGDMSLVGPRPPLVEEVQKYNAYQKQRLLVRPGLSGLWQISGRNNLSFEEMVELDIEYIRNPSMLLDVMIIVKTIYGMFNSKENGAF